MMKLFAQGVKENTDIVTDQIAKSFNFEQPIVDVTNTDTSATMNRDTNMETVIDLLQQLVEKDPVELGANAEGIFNLVRKKSTEFYKTTSRSAFA
jgi:plastocyanin domain-containing protein